MTTENTQKRTPRVPKRKEDNPSVLKIVRCPEESLASMRAHAVLRPEVQAGLTLTEYDQQYFGELDINTLVSDLEAQCEQASSGDFTQSEALLAAQVRTLDAIFHTLARRTGRTECLNQLEAMLRLALKAQNQCRTTLDTLAMIKQSHAVAFVRQANIAHGPQQVNNGSSATGSFTKKSENRPNELLEKWHGEWLDTKAAGAASRAHSAMEAMDAIYRPKNGPR